MNFYGNAWVADDPGQVVAPLTDDATYLAAPVAEPKHGDARGAFWQAGAAQAQEDVSFPRKSGSQKLRQFCRAAGGVYTLGQSKPRGAEWHVPADLGENSSWFEKH